MVLNGSNFFFLKYNVCLPWPVLLSGWNVSSCTQESWDRFLVEGMCLGFGFNPGWSGHVEEEADN